MSTYTQLIYHIVYSTKYRSPWLLKNNRRLLFRYMAGVLKNKKCHLYRINGVDDHIHILTHIPPSIALSDFVKDIKLASNYFIKKKKLYSTFNGWQEGYSAFTISFKEKNRLINYIKNQEIHHGEISYQDELVRLLKEQGVKFDKRFLD